MSPTLPMPSCSTEFFGFPHRPFRGTPDPEDYVVIETIDQEVQRLAAAAKQGDGIAVLTAAPGAGKTVVCQRLQAELRPRFEAVLLSSSGFATRRALLQAVLFALGQPYESCAEQELRLNILNYARTLATPETLDSPESGSRREAKFRTPDKVDATTQAAAAPREGIVLLVDEAHLLNVRLLEELRCLTNHSQGGRPLIRVVLCGQLPLEDALVNPALEALNYRITCHSTLEPLSMQESARLIAGRLQRAERAVEDIFTPEALETICRVSDGNPRCLMQLCEESLRFAAERKQAPVEAETVRVALHDLKQLPLQWNESAIDQPQPGVAAPQAEPATDDSWGAEASMDDAFTSGVSLAPGAEVPANDREDAPLGWSAAVSSVELGADCDLCETPPATAGWNSFEPESGWEPSAAAGGAGCGGEQDDVDADFPVCGLPVGGQCDDAPPSTERHQAAEFARSHDMTENRPQTDEIAAEPTLADAKSRNAFVELSVEDVYAALDAHKRRASAACEAGSFDEMLRPLVTAASTRARPSAGESIADADPPRRCSTDAARRDPLQSDPVQRLDEVIAALSEVTAESPAARSSVDAEWQSAGDCRAFDVLEPGGEPQWDQVPAGSPSHEPADRGEPQDGGRAESVHRPHGRPYARLFSRARQKLS